MKKRIFGKKKNWLNKRCNRWTGLDMIRATAVLTTVCSAIAGLPLIGVLIKEKLD